MRAPSRVLLTLGAACFLPMLLRAQSLGSTPMAAPSINMNTGQVSGRLGQLNPYDILQKHWLVVGKVVTLEGDPVPGAKVVVEPVTEGGDIRTLKTNPMGQFRTDYAFNTELVRGFSVKVTTTKKGFRKAQELIHFNDSAKPWIIPVTLLVPAEDPALLSQAELFTTLTPRLKTLGPGDGLSSKSEKDFTRGVTEYLVQKRPDHALPFFDKVIQRDPNCLKCRAMFSLAQLASGDWDGAYRNMAESINMILADRGLGRPEPLVIFGVMETWRHATEKSVGYFAEATKIAPQDALALQELGRTQLLLQNWGVANTYLMRAIAAGAGPEARFLRAETLLDAGYPDEANLEFTHFLDGRDVKSMPLYAREVWARIQNRKKVQVAYTQGSKTINRPIDYLSRTVPELKGLEPATDQKPLDAILSAVGKNVEEFFRQFPNTSSLEQIRQEKLLHNGKRGSTLDSKFRYLCLASTDPGVAGFDEYRLNATGDRGTPSGLKDGFMLTSGFASTSVLFLPAYQPGATFRYLGRQKLNGRDTLVLAFAQQPAKARVYGGFKSGGVSVPTFYQGLAWLDPASYQILRLRTDLLMPFSQVRLEKETTEIDFAEVHFQRGAAGFWLPQEVTVSVDWRGKHLRNVHQYSDYRIFNVESTQKIATPNFAQKTPKDATNPQ